MHINDFDTFKEWKDKTNHLSDGVGDTDHLTTLLATNVVEELLRVRNLTWDPEQIQDIVGAMVSNNLETGGISVTYDDNNGKLNFSGGAAGTGLSFGGIIDTVDGLDSLFDWWKNNNPVGECDTIDCFFEDVVRGPSGTNGSPGVRGMDADGGTYRVFLEAYIRTPDNTPPSNISDTNNGSSFDIFGNVNAFIAPTGWSTTTPISISEDDFLWASNTLVESVPIHNRSVEYQINDKVIYNSKTYEYQYDYSTSSTGQQLTLNSDTDAITLSPIYTDPDHENYVGENPTLTYDPVEGGFVDAGYGSLIPINSYNFITLQTLSGGTLPAVVWSEVVDSTGVGIGTKVINIPDWASPRAMPIAGDGADGRSHATLNVYTLSENNTTEPPSPVGGSYNFSGVGVLTAPTDQTTGPPDDPYIWVDNYKDATLPGSTTTYAQDRLQGTLWYTSVSFVADSPVGTVSHTGDWGLVLRSGSDGENATQGRIIYLYKRLTNNEAIVEDHPINSGPFTRWNFDTDQLEFTNTIGGGWTRWPETRKELLRLVTPSGSYSTFYSATDWIATARLGNTLPSTTLFDDVVPTAATIAWYAANIITQDRIDAAVAGQAFYGIDSKYIGYYLGTPKSVIDDTAQWFFRVSASLDSHMSYEHNLYVIESFASATIGAASPSLDTTLAWTPDIVSDGLASSNGADGDHGAEGRSSRSISLWNRNATTAPTLPDPGDIFYEFGTIADGETGNLLNIPTGWYLSPLNNINGYGCTVANCWSATDDHYEYTAIAIEPRLWVTWRGYEVGDYVNESNKTYECVTATSFDSINRATPSIDSPSSTLNTDWTEVTNSGASGLYSTIITNWNVAATEVGNQGVPGEAGSKIYSGFGAPTIAYTTPPATNADGTNKYEFTAPASLAGILVRLSDQYIDTENGEIYEVQIDSNDPNDLEINSLWTVNITGKEYNWFYRTWIPIDNQQPSSGLLPTAKLEVEAEIATARAANPTKTPSTSFDSVIPIRDTNNNEGAWTTTFPAVDEASHYIFGVAATYHRGDSLPAGDTSGVFNQLEYSAPIRLGEMVDGNMWFYGSADPSDAYPDGIYSTSFTSTDPVACSASNPCDADHPRMDVAGSYYIQTDPAEESYWILEDDGNGVLGWNQKIENIRGTDGDRTVTLYHKIGLLRTEPVPPASLSPLVAGDAPTDTSITTYWQDLEPTLTGTAVGKVIYKVTGYLEGGDVTGDWTYTTPRVDVPSIWHTPSIDSPVGKNFEPSPVDGDFYVQLGSDGSTGEQIWTFTYDTSTSQMAWSVIVSELTATRWFDGDGEPSNSLGNNGDWYLRTYNENVYKKISDVWLVQTNLQGESGDDGVKSNWIFKVDTSAPNTPNTGGTWDTVPTGWLNSPPPSSQITGDNKIWTSLGKTLSNGNTIDSWTTPTPLTGDVGQVGPGGSSSLILHKNSSSVPAVPTTYHIGYALPTTAPQSGVADWTNAPSTPTGSEYGWMTTGNTDPEDTDPTLYVFTSAIRVSGEDGQTITGDDGKRTATGLIYYNVATTSAPTAPSLSHSNYNFSTGQFTAQSLGSWQHSPPEYILTLAENLDYYALPYAIVEGTSVDLGNAIKSFNFDGVVSFTDLSNDDIGTTIIHGSNIETGTIIADCLKSGTTTDIGSDISFTLGAGATIGAHYAAGAFESNSETQFGLIVSAEYMHALGVGSKGDDRNTIVAVGGSNSDYTEWLVSGALASTFGTDTAGVSGAIYDTTTNEPYNEARLSTASYAGDFDGDVQADSFTPFTGSHDALIDPDTAMEGDIVVDVEVIAKVTISDTLTKVGIASSSNQKGVVGVFNNAKNKENEHPSSIFAKTFKNIGTVSVEAIYTIKPEVKDVYDAHDLISINSLGEGQVNVCGENGDLEIGDLIVTSSIAGKGMKQDDDIVRSITVAKVRENVTFSSPDEIKLVACIYMCG